MAQCQKQVMVYTASGPSPSSDHVATLVFVPDSSTPVGSCSALTVTASEFQDMQRGFITSREDADVIAGALIGLLTIGFIYKSLRRALEVDVGPSDEAH